MVYLSKKVTRLAVLLFVFIQISNVLSAQESHSIYQNYQFRPYDRYVYNSEHRFHTSVKPFQKRDLDKIVSLDTLYKYKCNRKIWDVMFNRSLIEFDGKKISLFNKKLADFEKEDFSFTIDPLINFEYGKGKGTEFEKNSWINTRGFLIKARIGKKFSLYTSFYENQASFNDYRYGRIEQLKRDVIPGQGIGKPYGDSLPTTKDFAFAEAYISYDINQYFNVVFGHGKNFFGDGYRSLLLSDNSFNYPYLKITTDFWHIKYVNLWAQFQDISQPKLYRQGYPRKWGAFQYLDWSVTKWLNVSLFEAVIWAANDTINPNRGFDINYANPVIFTRPVEFSLGSPDNVLMGLAGKLTLLKKHILYSQFIIDEFIFKEMTKQSGWWANKWALQLGYKTYDLFKLKHLDIQTEFNYVRPYMYSHLSTTTNYGHYNQPLAHPLGANFWESVTFLNYSYKRFFLRTRFSYALHGTDSVDTNYGNDIWKGYDTRIKEYDNYVGQYQSVKLQYIDVTLSYLVNPATNLNVFVNYTNRKEWGADLDLEQSLITFGIRTSLSNFYYDF